ncbi:MULTISPECIES: N-formylglutamate amidohydrolase [unclassified Pseudomonas]|jgi:predicted N-formylglutamate amidohydrolase|uniref:N-formylglutamate amidohydrolase n=1 Tax=unclassified Pseudomonas TaxID=196821 RepID=UPI000C876FC0|nr:MULTISPECIES: N-formylglutamate amidohydrolase [unclassified Pseudomonas]PMU08091.1 N-formylglutamate amidohydrolase [Pseudomonas sp. FW305-20]PMU19486.1 N-formylglutamate amidohydrolase [Pseudomonas sp. FW305-122]PMU35519.1 N-formylglutamate amidohydrolase [Pseudomonas sp. FW305-47B]PMX57494.1 N-formylglutamate amidohydrolase [Pseudomonas sp. FW305-33]PMX69480.1 N-formylglutamate amidohydrolase [Pseudomonas sp. FW305-60]
MRACTESAEFGLYTGPAYTLSREDSDHPLILVCEHASRFIPAGLNDLGLSHEAAREHIAWDIGALALAEGLSRALGATLLAANYSRLLVDLNRPLQAPDSIPVQSEIFQVPGNRGLDEATREYRRQSLFEPFHSRLTDLIDERVAQGRTVRVVGIHSFTPVYHDQPRALEVGVLFGKSMEYAQRLIDGLGRHPLKVAGNEPYKINPLGDMTVPVHGDARGLESVLIEVRNDLLRTPENVRRFTEYLAPLL